MYENHTLFIWAFTYKWLLRLHPTTTIYTVISCLPQNISEASAECWHRGAEHALSPLTKDAFPSRASRTSSWSVNWGIARLHNNSGSWCVKRKKIFHRKIHKPRLCDRSVGVGGKTLPPKWKFGRCFLLVFRQFDDFLALYVLSTLSLKCDFSHVHMAVRKTVFWSGMMEARQQVHCCSSLQSTVAPSVWQQQGCDTAEADLRSAGWGRRCGRTEFTHGSDIWFDANPLAALLLLAKWRINWFFCAVMKFPAM